MNLQTNFRQDSLREFVEDIFGLNLSVNIKM